MTQNRRIEEKIERKHKGPERERERERGQVNLVFRTWMQYADGRQLLSGDWRTAPKLHSPAE